MTNTRPDAVEAREPAAWAIAAERAASDAYAQWMGDPDGHDDGHSARLAAALAIEDHALAAFPAPDAEPFQARVQPWLMECFGPMIAGDREERNHRFLEEALELVQACSCTASEAHQLVDYVYGRPVGELHQEVGGVMVTLAALCLANDADMHAAGWVELDRIWGKVETIRAKQAAKPKHSPLAAAPASPPSAPADQMREALARIAGQKPRPELDEGDPGQRCYHCGYRRKLSEPMQHGPHCAYVIACAALAQPSVAASGGEPLREAALAAQRQFNFYAREHRAAGKHEKADTNQRFSDMLEAALRDGGAK
jgi:hypothetical protein